MVIVIDNITLLRLENGGLDDVRNILKNFIEQVSNVIFYVVGWKLILACT